MAAQILALLLVAVTGTAVAHTQDPVRQAMVSGVFGLALTITFLLLEAPGVAMAVAVVAVVAIPVMVVITVANMRGGEE